MERRVLAHIQSGFYYRMGYDAFVRGRLFPWEIGTPKIGGRVEHLARMEMLMGYYQSVRWCISLVNMRFMKRMIGRYGRGWADRYFQNKHFYKPYGVAHRWFIVLAAEGGDLWEAIRDGC